MNKISMRQACMIVIGMIFSPAVRLFSAYISGKGNQSGWLGPLIAGAITIGFLFVLWFLAKGGKNYTDHLQYSFGKAGSKIVMVLYLIWGTFLIALHLRYYSERMVSTVYADMSMDIFVLVMAGICVYVLSKGLATLGRMSEIVLPIILIVTAALLLLLTRDISAEMLLPIVEPKSIFHASFCSLASFGYVTFLLFFTDDIRSTAHFKRNGAISVFIVTIFSVWMFVAVIGSFGPYLIEKLSYPFLSVVKQISIGEFIQHIEAFIITLWILSDFLLVAFMGAAMLKVFGALIEEKETKEFVFPYFALCAALVPIVGRNNYELERLSENVFVLLNILLLFGLPLVLLVIEKIKDAAKQKKSA